MHIKRFLFAISVINGVAVLGLTGMDGAHVMQHSYLPTIEDAQSNKIVSYIKSEGSSNSYLVQCDDGQILISEDQFKKSCFKDINDPDSNDMNSVLLDMRAAPLRIAGKAKNIKKIFEILLSGNIEALSLKEKQQLFDVSSVHNTTLPWVSLIESIIDNPYIEKHWINDRFFLINQVLEPIKKEDVEYRAYTRPIKGHLLYISSNAKTLSNLHSIIRKTRGNTGNITDLNICIPNNPHVIGVHNNPIARTINMLKDLTRISVYHCNIETIPTGTFTNLRDGMRIEWYRNNTKHIQKGAFAFWNNGQIDIRENPLTAESREILLADTRTSVAKKELMNIRASMCRDFRYGTIRLISSIVEQIGLYVPLTFLLDKTTKGILSYDVGVGLGLWVLYYCFCDFHHGKMKNTWLRQWSNFYKEMVIKMDPIKSSSASS